MHAVNNNEFHFITLLLLLTFVDELPKVWFLKKVVDIQRFGLKATNNSDNVSFLNYYKEKFNLINIENLDSLLTR